MIFLNTTFDRACVSIIQSFKIYRITGHKKDFEYETFLNKQYNNFTLACPFIDEKIS